METDKGASGGRAAAFPTAVAPLVATQAHDADPRSSAFDDAQTAWSLIKDTINPLMAVSDAIKAAWDKLAGRWDDALAEKLFGRWYELRAAAQAWRNVADSLQATTAEVRRATIATQESWQGRAADAFVGAVIARDSAIDRTADDFRALAADFDDTADLLQDLSDAACEIITALRDSVLDAAAVVVTAGIIGAAGGSLLAPGAGTAGGAMGAGGVALGAYGPTIVGQIGRLIKAIDLVMEIGADVQLLLEVWDTIDHAGDAFQHEACVA